MLKLTVLVFHGIGSYWVEFGDEKRRFDAHLRREVGRRIGGDADAVLWKPVLWSLQELEERQAALLRSRRPPLAWKWLFEFVSAYLGDASAYTLPPESDWQGDSAYSRIQSEVAEALSEAERQLRESGVEAPGRVPVLAVAQSMGCHVLSNYAWDAAREPKRIVPSGKLSDFQKLAGLAGLVFTGCNLPVLTMGIARTSVMPMKLPKHPLADEPAFESRWLNFYDRQDVLGYPLDPEYRAYFGDDHDHRDRFEAWGRDPSRERAPEDRPIAIGGWRGVTPFAHTRYWRSPAVLDAIAAEIRRLLNAL